MNYLLKGIAKSLTIAGLLTVLVGCQVVGPNYTRPESRLPQQFAGEVQIEPDAAQQQAIKNWWQLYQDTQLNALVDKAIANNTDILLATARIEEADAQAKEIGANILPTVTLDGAATRNRVTEAGINPVFNGNPRSNYRLALNAAIELDFWGKLRRANEAARANLLATQYAKDTVQWSLSSLVANHYLTIRGLDAQLQVNAQNEATAQESLKLANKRLEGGVASVLDVHQAQLVIDNLHAQALDLKRLRSLSEHQLGLLTADFSVTVKAENHALMPTPPVPPAGLPSSLMNARPDVHQAEQQLIASNANIGLAKAALYPSVSLTSALGGESLELGDILKSAARIWSLGLDVSLPIFNGGKLNSRVDQANAKQKQALASYQAAVNTAFVEVNDALVNLRVYRERENVAFSKQATTQKVLTVAQNRYQSGYSSYLEVLDAQRNHNEATQAYVQSRQDTLTSSVFLFKALGGGWSQAAK